MEVRAKVRKNSQAIYSIVVCSKIKLKMKGELC